jgi:phenylacetate-CoA ligase
MDIVRKGEAGCDCGRTSMMIQEVAGRADDLCKIRGVLFTPVSVEELLRAEFSQIGEYEIIVERQGVMDTISLKFETREKIEKAPRQMLMAQLAERLKVRTNLRFNLQPVKYRDLPRYTLKAKRFKDLR